METLRKSTVDVHPHPCLRQPYIVTPSVKSIQTTAAVLILIVCVMVFPVSCSIECFKCVSVNGTNPACEDPFHNNYSNSILESPCMAGRKNREGLFPATACLKLSGYYVDNQSSVVIRSCALDSGTVTTDTELVRMSHCGAFVLSGRYVKGCLQSCDDADGCNGGRGNMADFGTSLLLLMVTAVNAYRWAYRDMP